MMRFAPVLALALLLPLVPPAASDPTVRLPCSFVPSAGPVDASCLPPIHPGARMANGCTLNWVVTDGTDLYIGTARHCVGALGEPLFVSGVGSSVGTLAFRGANDSAFYRIDAEDQALVSGTMEGFAGPTGMAPLGALPGQTVLHYGWGTFTAGTPAARGRAGEVVIAQLGSSAFWFVGDVTGGDSGSPVRLASGEALGHVIAALAPSGQPTLVVGVTLRSEMNHLANELGTPVTLVTGEPIVST